MLWLLALLACVGGDGGDDSGPATDSGSTDTDTDDTSDTQDTDPDCALGDVCNPIPVSPLPFFDSRDTTKAPRSGWDAYSCAPDTSELGGEFVYELVVTAPSVLSVSLSDTDGELADIDVHLLASADPEDCLERAHIDFMTPVAPGTYTLVADTWANSAGVPQSGAYELRVDLAPLPSASCATTPQDLRMFWSSCDGSLDCYEQGGDVLLRTPATGPVVKEAHLVSDEEDFGGGHPTSATDRVQRHYDLSEAASRLVFNRSEPWAPAGEGGSMWGQGSSSPRPPLVDETWYVNMHWRDRPARGTRMIVRNPANGRAVVAAAGYETGPGANTAIGGASEEIHRYLGTSHRDELVFGFATDNTLPLGPVACP